MNLSRHFTLAELTRSETASREGIPNEPDAAAVAALRALCAAVLDPLREAVGSAIKVNSGYRGPALNRRIGGAANSQHMTGQAADVQAPGVTVLALFQRVIQLGLPFDQLIYEAQNASVQWVHVSHSSAVNRGEIRVAQFGANGKPTGYPLVKKQQALAMVARVSRSRSARAELGYEERGDEPASDAPPVGAAKKTKTLKPRGAAKVVAKKVVTRATVKVNRKV